MRQVIETAVSQGMDELRQDVVRKVLAAVEPLAQSPAPALLAALRALEAATTQGELLTAIVNGAEAMSSRCALFVVRGATAVVYQARGFADGGRSLSVDLSTGLAARALQTRSAVAANAAEFDRRFDVQVPCVLAPIMLRQRPVGLLYAEMGSAETAEILARSAALSLELLTLRGASGAAQGTAQAVPVPQQPRPATTPVVPAPTVPLPAVTHAPQPPASASTVSQPAPGAEGVEDEIHRKARRFAKLLVDELKLYNTAKITAGKRAQNLYDVLRVDIEKSREAYNKRFATTPAANADYFSEELVRGLADGQVALLGPNFPR